MPMQLFSECYVVSLRLRYYKGGRQESSESMFAKVGAGGSMDRVAIALSGLCVVHCLATSVVLAVLASAGGLLVAPIVHEIGLTLAIFLGIVALGRGISEHGFMMPSAVGGLGLGVMSGALTMPDRKSTRLN